MIPYDQFLATVQVGHLQALATFTAGTRVRFQESDTAGIAAARTICQDLFNAGALNRVAEGYELVGVEQWHTFDGYVNEVAAGYVWQLARERLVLSREPLPPA